MKKEDKNLGAKKDHWWARFLLLLILPLLIEKSQGQFLKKLVLSAPAGKRAYSTLLNKNKFPLKPVIGITPIDFKLIPMDWELLPGKDLTLSNWCPEMEAPPLVEVNREQMALQEVGQIPSGQEISSDLIEKYGPLNISKGIVSRLHMTKELSDHPEEGTVDYYQMGSIQLAFHPHIIDQLLEEKEFKNQHRTRTSSMGFLSGLQRQGVESYMADLKIKNPDLLPKYGFLNFVPNSFGLGNRNFYSMAYGPIMAVFKDEVKERSTFTTQDSISLDSQKKLARTFYYRNPTPLALTGNYFEAQIWGPLGIEDVAYYMVEENTSDYTLENLKKLGRPIFIKEMVKVGNYLEEDNVDKYTIVKGRNIHTP